MSDQPEPQLEGLALAEAALRDVGRMRQVAEALLKQSTRIEAAIRRAYPDATVCLHSSTVDLTSMGDSEKRVMCLECEAQWTEPHAVAEASS